MTNTGSGVSSKALVISEKKARYLLELQEHREDSGGTESLGSPTELIDAFNMYAIPKRNKKIAFIIFVACFSLLFSLCSPQLQLTSGWGIVLYDAESAWGGPISMVIGFVGYILYAPYVLIVATLITIGSIINRDMVGWLKDSPWNVLIQLSPLFIAAFWTLVTTYFSFFIKEKLPRK